MCSSGKALIVSPFFKPNIGGVETFAEDLAKALSKKYVVHICTIKWDKQIIFEGMDYKKAFLLIRKLAIPLLKMKWKYKYEKVYALGLMSSFLCVLFGIKFNAVVFNLYEKRSWYTAILNRAEKVFVEGNTGVENLKQIGVKKSVPFHHWCDQTVFIPKERNNKNMKVLFIGRPIEIKGKHIIEECQRMTTGIDYEYVENCEFRDLPKHYQGADVVVVPSLYNDTFSRVCVEAASCGCAVVVSNRGSLPEQVEGFGRAIDPDPISFAYILNRLNSNRNALYRLQLETTVYAKKHFNEKNADCFLL